MNLARSVKLKVSKFNVRLLFDLLSQKLGIAETIELSGVMSSVTFPLRKGGGTAAAQLCSNLCYLNCFCSSVAFEARLDLRSRCHSVLAAVAVEFERNH